MDRGHEIASAAELAGLPTWERSLELSRAFVESAFHLCTAMCEGDFPAQYSMSRVVLHLARQSIELFLKGALEIAGCDTKKMGHNLVLLHESYRQQYPSQRFVFSMPRAFLLTLDVPLFSEVDDFHKTLDQRHRYASDRFGVSFASPEVFDPEIELAELDRLRSELQVIEWVHLRSIAGVTN